MRVNNECGFLYKNMKITLKGYSSEDHILKTICNTKLFYEIDLLEYILLISKLGKFDTTSIIDVGANIGNHSIFFKKFIANQVMAIEPNRLILPILRHNLEANKCEVIVIDKAIGCEFGQGGIDIVSETNIGMAKINKTTTDTNTKIDIITLDSLENELINPLSIIKIDVEGMEFDVIKGAQNIIKNNKPEIFAEITDNVELEKIHNFLKKYGYYIVSVWGATPMYHFSTLQRMKYIYVYQKLKKYLCSFFR